MNVCECIVIGGGIAGGTAAYHLARRGYEVTVLERSTGPHHKVCGEFLSHEGMGYLSDMGLDLEKAGMPWITALRLMSGKTEVRFSLPDPARGVSRYWLDEILLQKAVEAGTCVQRGVCVTGYRKETKEFHVSTTAGDFRARFLFIAHGKHDIQKHQIRTGTGPAFMGFKMHLKASEAIRAKQRNVVSLFPFDGGYAGVSPVEREVLNLCFIMRKEVYKERGRHNGALPYLRRAHVELGEILDHSEPQMPLQAIGCIPYGFLRRRWPDGMFYLGDQRAVTPSFTGDGMAMALKTAVDEVNRFHAVRQGRMLPKSCLQNSLQSQLGWALLGHALIRNAFFLAAFARIGSAYPYFLRLMFQKTRIA